MKGYLTLCILSAFLIFVPLLKLTSQAHASEDKEWRVESATKDVEIRGYTRSIKYRTIASEVSGKIVKVNYEVGDAIKSAPFAEVDTTFIDFEIQSTKIAIAKTDTQLKQIDSRIAYLKKEFIRKEELFKKGRATEVIRDAASQELDQANLERQAVRQAKESLDVALNQLIERKKRHAIWGQSDWVVTQKMVEVGEIIQAGSALGVIHDFRQLVVPLSLSNDELQAIKRLGENFEALIENEPAVASIYYINPDFNEQSRKTDLKLIILDGEKNSKYEHRGGLSFTLPLSVQTEGLKISADAVENRYENPKVYIKGELEPVSINIIDRAEEFLIIAEHPKLNQNTILIKPDVK
ncbi:MAG: HlyD family efflux transporter periplasmic adaptor subunit [Desulfamplus sp.]|nr:HlyD family efflux transporter periplasmic adaptor subunit [Desulfamplus sp.]